MSRSATHLRSHDGFFFVGDRSILIPCVAMRDASLALALCLIACGPPPRNGGDGNTGIDGNGSGGDGSNRCASETKLVYTIDQFNNRLSQFDPATRTVHHLGSLSCPPKAGATPFSLSVQP